MTMTPPSRYKSPFAPGDVVWGPDAFHDDDPRLTLGSVRPWLVVSNEALPGHGTQYVCCGLTHNLAGVESFLAIYSNDWEKGGTTEPSQIDTETLFTMKQRWITQYSGRLRFARLQEARRRIRSYL